MPTRFLSDAEIARLKSFPESIERRDLVRFFSLAGQDDLAFVRGQRGAPNRPLGSNGTGTYAKTPLLGVVVPGAKWVGPGSYAP
jgi:hypothetical protein